MNIPSWQVIVVAIIRTLIKKGILTYDEFQVEYGHAREVYLAEKDKEVTLKDVLEGIATASIDVTKHGNVESIVLHDIKATSIEIDYQGIQQDSISLEGHKRYRIEITEEK